MATAAQKEAYVRKMRDVLRRYAWLEKTTIEEILASLVDYRDHLAGVMSTATDYSVFHRANVLASLDDYTAQYKAILTGKMNYAVSESDRLGGLFLVEPINAALGDRAFLVPNPLLNTLLSYTTDLVTNVTSEMSHKISNVIKLAALGGVSPYDSMVKINDILGVVGDKVTGVAYRSERIFRTELMRAFNMSNQAQREALAETVPEIKKDWIATGDDRTRESHMRAHLTYRENPIPVKEPFVVGGALLMEPGDPGGPPEETVNCRCTSSTIHPEIGVIESELDDRIRDLYTRKYGPIEITTPPVPPAKFKLEQDWHPSMTRAEAEIWAMNSKYRSDTYHVTYPEAVDSISREGFDLSKKKWGKMFGDGVYVGTDKATAKMYTHWFSNQQEKSTILTIKANVSNVLTVDMGMHDTKRTILILAGYKDPRGDMAARGFDTVGSALVPMLQEKGYDALFIRMKKGADPEELGGNQLIIFNPRNVTVIR